MKRKITIIGAGHVGTHCAYSLCHRSVCTEIALIDIDREKCAANAWDIADAVSFMPTPVKVHAGDYSDCADSDILVIAAGVPRLPGQTRLDVMGASVAAAKEILPHLRSADFGGIVISISNPCDVIADYFRKGLGFEKNRVFGTGTTLDSARLRRILSELTGYDPVSVQAYSMGEHGDSQMIPFSAVSIGGKRFDDIAGRLNLDKERILERTRMIGMDIINGKNATEFGIGYALADMAQAVLNDEKRILPASALLEGEYGQYGLHAGVPCVIGENGIEEIIELPLTEEEKERFDASCAVIKDRIAAAAEM